jgi:hypothetical protein
MKSSVCSGNDEVRVYSAVIRPSIATIGCPHAILNSELFTKTSRKPARCVRASTPLRTFTQTMCAHIRTNRDQAPSGLLPYNRSVKRLGGLASVVALATLLGCASQQIDPHNPGDRCLYTCPDGMACAGTTFQRARANPGRCELAPERCLATTDCRAHEDCVRAGEATGVCRPRGLL